MDRDEALFFSPATLLNLEICQKIWSAKHLIMVISYFKILSSCWLSVKSTKSTIISQWLFLFLFPVSCGPSLKLNLLNAANAAGEVGWHLLLCSLWYWTWHSCWNNGARIKISSFSLTHCCRQLHSFAELSSAPLLWLQIIFFSHSDCFDMEKKNTRVVALFASIAFSCCVTIPCT